MSEGRTIIKTSTAGWYEDPVTGKKTRKQDGDNVMSRAEYDQMVLDADPSRTDAPAAKPESNGKPQAPVAALPTGKVAVGETIDRRCAWVDPDKRTDAQEKLFASNFKGVDAKDTYDRVKDAAGGKRSAMPDGTTRRIKVQDSFQVRFSPENQRKWRAELRRRKNKARREAARKAAKK